MKILLILFILSLTALATKPCAPNPCFVKCKFDQKKCEELSTWIATGKIVNVRSDKKPKPLNKDFAQFDFLAHNWKKSAKKKARKIQFKVGWCNNQKALPKDYSGDFVFYGKSIVGTENQGEYLYFHSTKIEK